MARSIIYLTVFVFAIPFTAFANDVSTMICKGGIVSIGDSMADVLSRCGQPAVKTQREERRVEKPKQERELSKIITTVSIDEWTFNFGANEFMHMVLFENGRAKRIESLGYGY